MAESIATVEARLLVNALKPHYPLDVTWLACQLLGKPAEIHEHYFPVNICAIIVDKKDYETIHIGVNCNRTRTSQRFAVVHELAHAYLGHRGDISFVEDEEDPVLHAEADAFATEMLMPKHRILSLTEKCCQPLPLIRLVMRNHNVSLEATCRRIIELEIYRGAFVCFNELRPLFAYSTPGFDLGIERISNLPKLARGCYISRKEIIRNVPVINYLQRFKSGNSLAAWVENNPVSLYQKILDYWLEGAK